MNIKQNSFSTQTQLDIHQAESAFCSRTHTECYLMLCTKHENICMQVSQSSKYGTSWLMLFTCERIFPHYS